MVPRTRGTDNHIHSNIYNNRVDLRLHIVSSMIYTYFSAAYEYQHVGHSVLVATGS